jgi:WD40 repeat protein
MKIVSRIAVTVAAYSILVAAAACAPAPTGQPMWNSPSQETTATASIPSGSFTPTRTKFPTRTRPYTPTATPTITTLDPEASILPGWVPEGARARLGRGIINQIALSPDGKTVAVAGATGLSLFTSDTFQEVWSVPTNEALTEVDFLSSGKEIVTLTDCCTMLTDCSHGCDNPHYCLTSRLILVWDAASGELLKTIAVEESFDHLEVIPGGKSIVIWYSYYSFNPYYEVRVLELSTGNMPIKISSDDRAFLTSLVVSPDGKSIIGALDTAIVIWDMQSGKRTRVLESSEAYENHHLSISQDGSLLASDDGSEIIIWDLTAGVPKLNWRTGYYISLLALSPDGQVIVSGENPLTGYRRLDSWDVDSGNRLAGKEVSAGIIRNVEFFPEGNDLLVGFDHFIQSWDFKTGSVYQAMTDPFSHWTESGFFGDGNAIALLPTSERVISIFDTENLNWINSIIYPEGAVFSPVYRWYAFPNSGSEIVVAETKTGRWIHAMSKPEYFDSESGLFLALDGLTIAIIHPLSKESLETDYRIELWDLTEGRILDSLDFHVLTYLQWGIIFTPDLQRVMHIWTGGGENWEKVFDIYDMPTGQQINQFDTTNYFGEISLSDDGQSYSGPCFDGLCIYDLGSGEIRVRLSTAKHGEEDAASSFSRDGKYFVSSSQDGFVMIWRTDTGELLHTFKGHNGPPDSLSFSLDNKRLVSTGDGSVVVWDLDPLS